ncbi:trypsin-like serine peptidase [Lichenibacterium dinghuense]|uniref:trypsin-like serine peptidase n=1 Tax=Lichenibacterium dinghuense TaxID=2895977 RepID=UPI001F33DE56|nr:trypsin-like peptidase domain-containing protein [Lichenibacterium sp. 6Y81]
MTTYSDPTDAVVSISWQTVSGTTITTEQGSGVLIAPDEVLTAAHVVYDASGHTVANAVVSSAAGGTLHTVGVESAVHAMPLADWTQVASAAGDFALIHLAAPATGLPTMALGSGFAGGAVSVTGFPLATAGAEDNAAEDLAPLPGTAGILQGPPLGAPGDPHGASGGPAWQTIGGVPTVVGLTSSASGSTGYFVGLTAADVAEIDAWMAADRAASVSQSSTVQSAAVAPPAADAPSPASDAISALSTAAAGLPAVASHPAIDAAMSRVVNLLTRDAAALGAGAAFDDVAADALSGLGDNSAHRNLAAALLEGIVWGHDGGGIGGAVPGVAGSDPGLLSYTVAKSAVHAGAVAGQQLAAAGY